MSDNKTIVELSAHYQLMEIEREEVLMHWGEGFWEVNWVCQAVNDLLKNKFITADTVKRWLST